MHKPAPGYIQHFIYYKIILDKVSSLIRDIYRENLIGLFVKVKEELELARI